MMYQPYGDMGYTPHMKDIYRVWRISPIHRRYHSSLVDTPLAWQIHITHGRYPSCMQGVGGSLPLMVVELY